MNNEVLSGLWLNSPRVFQLADRLTMSAPQAISLKNLQGSSPAFVINSILHHDLGSQVNHLVICEDAESAAYMHNTIENLSGALDVFYFPSSFKNTRNYRLLNSSHVMLRTEALTRWSAGGNKKIIVTYPEALFEKVVLPKALSGNIIYVKSGDTIEPDVLMERLVRHGFERTDFVYEPGQLALRGGILDIYSFGNEKPYRIELFGNDVDSIRIFDPETQLSERKLLQVSNIPNIETQFSSEEKISLFDFIPENTVVWIKDWEFTRERLIGQEEELELFLEYGHGGDQLTEEPASEKIKVNREDFIDATSLEAQLKSKHLVEFGHRVTIDSHFEIEFHTRSQPSFNRQFDMLITDLKGWESRQYGIYLFAENPRQLERLYTIFEDLKSVIHFTPIPLSIYGGFIDEDLKVLCFTDHELFQRYHKYKVRQAYNKNKALTLRTLRELQPGDYVTHIDHGVGVYSGLQKIEANGRIQEAVRIIYRDSDILYVNINSLHKISKYTGKEGTVPRVNKLGSDVWQKLKDKTKTKVKEIAFDLIKLYAQRKAQQGFAHAPDNYMQTELEASFIYEDTPDQSKATADVKKDMESPSPMDRLVCGDVGFGKTEIAIRDLPSKPAAMVNRPLFWCPQRYWLFSILRLLVTG